MALIALTPQSVLSNAILLNDLVNAALKIDAVGVFNQETFDQVFHDARPMKARVRETSMVMNHPVETGVILSDHHIINPTEIDLVLITTTSASAAAYQEIRTLWTNATLLSVQTRTGVYLNMIINDLPHEEDPDMMGVITIGLRLKEVLFVVPASIASPTKPANYKPLAPANSNTVPRGFQSSLFPVTASVLSYIHLGTFLGA